MSIFNLISDREINLIDKYVDTYAIPSEVERTAPVTELLAEWDKAKSETLIKLLNGSLILEKKINVELPFYELEGKVIELCGQYEKELFEPVRKVVEKSSYRFYEMFGSEALVKNKVLTSYAIPVEIWNPETGEFEATIKVMPGSKAIRSLGKIAKFIGLGEIFEEFRIKHSMILNTKRFDGVMRLSIHPLDYMTMSDNDSSWSSCMSWRRKGCYRQGTVEMMNSKYVVVAYLLSKEDMHLFYGKTEADAWANKKWRELFIVDPTCIVNVKSYPYYSEELTTLSLNWVKELATQNLGWEYRNEPEVWYRVDGQLLGLQSMNFYTDYMYNDICHDDEYKRLVYIGKDTTKIDINYSGVFTCMACGRVESIEVDEGTLVGCECDKRYYCEKCNDMYRNPEDMRELDGYYYCPYCFFHLHRDPITNKPIHSHREFELYFVDMFKDKIVDVNYVIFDNEHFYDNENFKKLNKYFNCIRREYFAYSGHSSWIRETPPYVLESDLTEEGKELLRGFGNCVDSNFYNRKMLVDAYSVSQAATIKLDHYTSYSFGPFMRDRVSFIMRG